MTAQINQVAPGVWSVVLTIDGRHTQHLKIAKHAGEAWRLAIKDRQNATV